MEQIGIRELRQQASVWLRRVAAGESFEVTDRGRPVALLVPARHDDALSRLRAEGRATAASRSLAELPPPRKLDPAEPSLSKILEEMRAGEH